MYGIYFWKNSDILIQVLINILPQLFYLSNSADSIIGSVDKC